MVWYGEDDVEGKNWISSAVHKIRLRRDSSSSNYTPHIFPKVLLTHSPQKIPLHSCAISMLMHYMAGNVKCTGIMQLKAAFPSATVT